MTPAEFRDRLETVARRTGLTASDLAVWFGRPRPTVRTWLHGTRPQSQIGGHVWDELARRLIWLEQAMCWEFVDQDGPMHTRPLTRPELREAFDRERLKSIRQARPQVDGDVNF